MLHLHFNSIDELKLDSIVGELDCCVFCYILFYSQVNEFSCCILHSHSADLFDVHFPPLPDESGQDCSSLTGKIPSEIGLLTSMSKF